MNYNDQTVAAGWTCANCLCFVPINKRHACPTVPSSSGAIPLDGWKAVRYAHENEKVALKVALLVFEEKLTEYQIQMPPEFIELVEKYSWELV